MKFRNLILFITFIICHASLMFSQYRLDSIRTKSVSSPTADTAYRGNDFAYDGSELKKQTNVSFVNGQKKINTYSEFDQSVGNYSPCVGFYFGSGDLSRFTCEFDSTVNNKLARCTKSFELINGELKLTSFKINFKTFGFGNELLVDSTVNLKPETLEHDLTSVFCYTYDNKLNVVELIRKTLQGNTTFYGDKTDYDIKYDVQGRKESEIITWTYILQTRTIDSIAYAYLDNKIIEQKYLIFSSSGSTNGDLSVATKDVRGVLNVKLFRKNPTNTELYLRSNADYFYSLISAVDNFDTYKNYKIFPNPAFDKLHLDNDIPVNFRIYTVSGSIILEGYLMPGETIDINSLPQGLYNIEAYTDPRSSKTQRFFKY